MRFPLIPGKWIRVIPRETKYVLSCTRDSWTGADYPEEPRGVPDVVIYVFGTRRRVNDKLAPFR
jgi:hypothetical protein